MGDPYGSVCPESYINATAVYYVDQTGSRKELLFDDSDRTSDTWDCYAVESEPATPGDGHMLIWFNLHLENPGDAITFGRIAATLAR